MNSISEFMINKHLDKIDISDLKQLQSNAVSEGKTIEYKKLLPTNSYADRKEFLADISSFSNASGGDLIFGILEENGSPKSIDGLEIENVDEEIRKYENIIRDGIEPRIIFATRAVNVSGKKNIFIFRVNKSWVGPHRVIYEGHDKFYSRNSAGKYALDTNELKSAFNLSQTLTEQINKFKTERITQLISDNLPLPFYDGGKIVLHLIPLESFSPNYRIDLNPIINEPAKLKPIYASGWSYRINLEGVLSYSGGRNDKSHSYIQLYRNGIIEAVEGLMLSAEREKKYIPSVAYEIELIKSLREFLNLTKELGINMPIVIFLTLIGVNGYEMAVDRMRFWGDYYKIDKDILQLPETLIESYNTEPKDILRPMFDLVWNACGFKRSYNFDEAGNWTAK
ncbi:MAG: ATP-binding protein [Candidatus Moranbacteria bacterium CG06_land_8_20_14_3_00_43_56]|nr:MAG: ATP-binding protein [Candidatus Moranbacteria bacterium CG06_land_8_20_14_3_00_43_56]PJA85419.1 MAG: ATP-binding protein [Candidatus Moranbacteria bacterium CG_4_9_14_3_um_filter_44_28]